jgi:hypothetical protein
MSTRTVTLNAAAVALFALAAAEATKVRVRTSAEGAVQLRPTTRVSAVNLPKTEALRDLRVKDNSRRFSVADESLTVGQAFSLVKPAGSYGWFTLVPAESVVAGVPGARVSDR